MTVQQLHKNRRRDRGIAILSERSPVCIWSRLEICWSGIEPDYGPAERLL